MVSFFWMLPKYSASAGFFFAWTNIICSGRCGSEGVGYWDGPLSEWASELTSDEAPLILFS